MILVARQLYQMQAEKDLVANVILRLIILPTKSMKLKSVETLYCFRIVLSIMVKETANEKVIVDCDARNA